MSIAVLISSGGAPVGQSLGTMVQSMEAQLSQMLTVLQFLSLPVILIAVVRVFMNGSDSDTAPVSVRSTPTRQAALDVVTSDQQDDGFAASDFQVDTDTATVATFDQPADAG